MSRIKKRGIKKGDTKTTRRASPTCPLILYRHADPSSASPIKVAETYSDLMFGLYYKKHDVARMLFIGRAGIQYCLSESQSVQNRKHADELKLATKRISYNLGSFTWPGWNEPGITVTRSDMLAGLDAARLNFRLAQDLKRGVGPVGGAHWLLGAQHLAFGETDRAIEQFARTVEQFRQAQKDDSEHMARGYIGIAKITVKPSREEGRGGSCSGNLCAE